MASELILELSMAREVRLQLVQRILDLLLLLLAEALVLQHLRQLLDLHHPQHLLPHKPEPGARRFVLRAKSTCERTHLAHVHIMRTTSHHAATILSLASAAHTFMIILSSLVNAEGGLL